MRATTIILELFLLINISISVTPHIDWCLYWRYLNKDQYRPECNGVYKLRFAKHKVYDYHRTLPAVVDSRPITPIKWISDRSTPIEIQTNSLFVAPSNYVGVDHSFGQCLAIHSNCQQSKQCSSGQLCVDSNGYCCGQKRVLTQCPSPHSLATNCFGRQRQVNWCSSDAECAPHLAPRQNALYSDSYLLDSLNRFPSLCCPTQCGYNVCIR